MGEEFRQLTEDRIYIRGTKNALSILRENGIRIPANCSGRGSCGKCRIIAEGENIPVSAEDRAAFREDELAAGYRLACRFIPEEGAVIRIPDVSRIAEEDYTAVDSFALAGDRDRSRTGMSGNQTESREGNSSGEQAGPKAADSCRDPIRAAAAVSAAVDIGTTTLAFAGVADDTGEVIRSVSAMNPQRQYGADVMSRIAAAEQGAAEPMKRDILRAIAEGLRRIGPEEGPYSERPERKGAPKRIAIAGNTVMLHLLRGYDVSGLGRVPFRAVTLKEEKLTAAELFGEERPEDIPEDTPVSLLPGISAFVGADITAGLYGCDFFTRKDRAFLLDLGTNGEMALLSDGVLYTASTAAGPAFEGGNISCGIGSVEGAVSDVSLSKDAQGRLERWITVIGGGKPAGLCGTGLIALVSELKRMELMDEMGLLNEEYFEDGFPFAGEGPDTLYLTQKDIRELQLAKGAIRAGISILLARAGLKAEDIDQVYLAGGFGFFLDTEKAINICLLPSVWRGKIAAAGNSCIGGLIRYLTEGGEVLEGLFDRDRIVELNLAEQPDFYDQYMDAMAFEEEF